MKRAGIDDSRLRRPLGTATHWLPGLPRVGGSIPSLGTEKLSQYGVLAVRLVPLFWSEIMSLTCPPLCRGTCPGAATLSAPPSSS